MSRYEGGMTRLISIFACGLAILSNAAALAAESDWMPDHASRFRVLLAPNQTDGTIMGGIEIQLEPGWHTYWRTPGEAGMPPRFDFTGSENVEKAEVLFPAPERYVSDGSVSVVYHQQVVFPVLVVPTDPDKPVRLAVDALYGVCREVCIPVQSQGVVEISPGEVNSPLARITIEQFLNRVPGEAERGRFDIEIAESDDAEIVLRVIAPNPDPVDLFVDPPPSWYIAQPRLLSRDRDISLFSLSLSGQSQGDVSEPLRFVAVSGGSQIAKSIALPQK